MAQSAVTECAVCSVQIRERKYECNVTEALAATLKGWYGRDFAVDVDKVHDACRRRKRNADGEIMVRSEQPPAKKWLRPQTVVPTYKEASDASETEGEASEAESETSETDSETTKPKAKSKAKPKAKLAKNSKAKVKAPEDPSGLDRESSVSSRRSKNRRNRMAWRKGIVPQHNDEYETPPALKDDIYKEFKLNHDPCPIRHGKKEPKGGWPDALDRKVAWGKRNYVNPPFSKAKQFIERAIEEMNERGSLSVVLVPASRCNAKYWKETVVPNACEIRQLTCKPFFSPADRDTFSRGFPIPLALLVFDPKRKVKRKDVESAGGAYSYVTY